MNGEEGLKCEVHVDGVYLEHVSKLIYLGCVLDKVNTDRAEFSRKVAGAIRSLVNARDLQIEYVRILMKHCLYLILRMAVIQCY